MAYHDTANAEISSVFEMLSFPEPHEPETTQCLAKQNRAEKHNMTEANRTILLAVPLSMSADGSMVPFFTRAVLMKLRLGKFASRYVLPSFSILDCFGPLGPPPVT